MARDTMKGQLAGWWAIGSFVFVMATGSMANDPALFERLFSTPPTFAVCTGQGHWALAVFAILVGGVAMALSRFQPHIFFIVTGLATVAVLCLSFMSLREGWAISGSTVTVRPAEFWKPDATFTSADITSVRRSCGGRWGNGGTYTYDLNVDADYSVGGRTGSWSSFHLFSVRDTKPLEVAHVVDALSGLRLRSGVPSQSLGHVLAAERILTPKALAADDNFQSCVGYFTKLLDPKRAAELRIIAGAT